MDKEEFGRKVLERVKSKDNKKSQQDTAKPPTYLFDFLNDLYNPPFVPINIPPEQRFKNLLDFFKSGEIGLENKARELVTQYGPVRAVQSVLAGLAFPALPERRRRLQRLMPIATKVMESGIFFKGGLKGASNPSPREQYESFAIQDLDQFILDLASVLYLHERGEEYPSAFQSGTFFEAVKSLELYILGVEIWKGKRAAQRLKSKLEDLQDLAWKTEAKPNLHRPRSLEMFAREMGIMCGVVPEIDYENSKGPRLATKRKVVGIFIKHIKAPGTIIAERVTYLLDLFGIKAKFYAIRKMLPKKQQTL
jgi:hypothetical protein